MLRSYARKLRSVVRAVADYKHTPPRALMESAFRGFYALDGNRDSMLAKLTEHTRHAAARFDEFVSIGNRSRAFAKAAVDGAARIDDGTIWHEDLGLRSYVDVSLQVKALRAVLDVVSATSADSLTMQPIELAELVADDFPDRRPALLAYAELLLEEGTPDNVDAAIDLIRRAQRIDSVCPSAQKLLRRAETMKGDAVNDDLADKFCHVPFTHFSTGFRGEVFPCMCPAFVPYSIGNVLEAKSAEEIWNSTAAMEIRRSVLDGDYSYCSRTLCPYITSHKLPTRDAITDPVLIRYIETHATRIDEAPEFVELNHDPTCNLACPSCRTEIIVSKAEEQDVFARAADEVILPLLKKVCGQTYITGGGEAFASKHFQSILGALNRDEYPGLGVILITNGTRLTPSRWVEYPHLAEMADIVMVSLDAARAETYEKLRTPAKWNVVIKNLEHMAQLRREGVLKALGLNFVVQKANFREMLEFVALGERLGADLLWFQRVSSYGSFDEATFADVDVTSPLHSDHAELLEMLRHPLMQRKEVHKILLDPLLPEVVAAKTPARYVAQTRRERPNHEYVQPG